MEPVTPAAVRSLLPLGDGLLTTMRERLERFTVELQQEKIRRVRLFTWISAVVFTGLMAVLLAGFTLVHLGWEIARVVVLGGLLVLYGGAVGAIIIAFHCYLAWHPKLATAA